MIGLGLQEMLIIGAVAIVAVGAIVMILVSASRSGRANERHRPD